MKEETWKAIIGFKGYIVSYLGNVISKKRRGIPKKLKGKGSSYVYCLVSDKGENRHITKKKLVYAFLHEINPDSISGYIIGPLDELRLVSKEEFYAYICQQMTDSKKRNQREMEQFYDESIQDILLFRQFYQTGDITPIAEAIHRNKEVIVDYIVKYMKYGRPSAYDIWSDIQEKMLLGIYGKRLTILNIRSYLAGMVRNEVMLRRKKASLTVEYEDCRFYKGV